MSAHTRPQPTIAQRLLRAMRRWQRRRAVVALRRLTDGQLADIGMDRSGIPQAAASLFRPAHGPLPGRPSSRPPRAAGTRRKAA